MRIVNRRNCVSGTYVGRPTPLGNPFRIGQDGTRLQVIQKYRRWLYERIMAGDRTVLDALAQLTEDSVLVCSCVPEPCHAEVIEKAWLWAKKEGLI